MVIHSQGVCRGTLYFAPHVLRPSIAFTMDFNVGDKVLHTRSNCRDKNSISLWPMGTHFFFHLGRGSGP